MEPIAKTSLHSLVDRGEVRRAAALLLDPRAPAELRVLDARGQGTLTGIYEDHAALVRDALHWSGRARAVFVTLNPLRRSAPSRAANRLHPLDRELLDSAIARRRWFPLDFDPNRPIGTNSSAAERSAAFDLALTVRDWLRRLGWPDPVLADSGNGAHLLYRVDLANDANAARLVHLGLAALDLRFSTPSVTLDAVVEDAARLWKLYGTLVAKGRASAERPHRLSRIVEAPAVLEPVPVELLRDLPCQPARGQSRAPNGDSGDRSS
jgi:hypothetical protein